MNKRVVITGVGVISSLGVGVEKFWENIKQGKCGISKLTKFDTTDYPTKVASVVDDFKAEDYIDKKDAKRMDRYTQFGVSATKLAIENAGLDLEKINKERFGVILGCGIGGIETFEEQAQVLAQKGASRITPFLIPMMIANMASGQIAIAYGAKGINETIVTACASGTNAIGDAYKCIQRGEADVLVSGGTEASITPLGFAGFCSLKAMTKEENPMKACRPFDIDRDGFVMGEGSGIVIMEEYEHAKARGANILAEIVGYGATCDAYHMTAPSEDGEGGARAMSIAIADAGIKPSDIDYINAHGTSTPLNDKLESKAIKTVLGEHSKKVMVSSTKSMTGHLLGAAGGVEALICALALKEGFVPATINLENPDPECDLDYVPNVGRKIDINYAMSNSLGFGGHNATIILKKI